MGSTVIINDNALGRCASPAYKLQCCCNRGVCSSLFDFCGGDISLIFSDPVDRLMDRVSHRAVVPAAKMREVVAHNPLSMCGETSICAAFAAVVDRV